MAIHATGTDLSKSNIVKSNKFAAKSGLPPYYHVLHPRTRGWCVNVHPLAMPATTHFHYITDLSFLFIPHEDNAIEPIHHWSHVYVSRWLFYDGLKEGLDAVYDVTIGYVEHTPGERTSRKFLFNGRAPRQLHISVKRYAASDLKVEPTAPICQQLLTQLQPKASRQRNNNRSFRDSSRTRTPPRAGAKNGSRRKRTRSNVSTIWCLAGSYHP